MGVKAPFSGKSPGGDNTLNTETAEVGWSPVEH